MPTERDKWGQLVCVREIMSECADKSIRYKIYERLDSQLVFRY